MRIYELYEYSGGTKVTVLYSSEKVNMVDKIAQKNHQLGSATATTNSGRKERALIM